MRKKTNNMGELSRALCALGMSEFYPFHMPGHKRNPDFMALPAVNSMDITEIDGFDDLHHPSGILKAAQERAASVRGAERTWFLVNGSTVGILAAVSACTQRGGRILMARNCHKAVYNAVELRGLRPVYVYPKLHEEYGIYDGVDAAAVSALLEKYKDIQAVVITSPTYEGVISDVKAIAGIVHGFGIPLIVDSAHGAHLGYGGGFGPSAVALGADLVIESLHKTLPSMTQTALLHRCGRLADDRLVQKYLSMYQSSSPSYVMMAAMDQCMALLKDQAAELFEEFRQRLDRLRSRLGRLSNIRLLDSADLCRAPGSSLDPSKLVLYVREPGHGRWLYDRLREDWLLQLEMASADYALAMTSICDTDEGFERLAHALEILDRQYPDSAAYFGTAQPSVRQAGIAEAAVSAETPELSSSDAAMYPVEQVTLGDACGRISGDYLYIYPPGVPFCVPGERITAHTLDVIRRYRYAGLTVEGLRLPETAGLKDAEDLPCMTVLKIGGSL